MALLSIPPELFHHISSFIPLRLAQRTLLSLAFGNRELYDIVSPLLYSRLVLGNEGDAILVIQKILGEPQLGKAVTELYLIAELSAETRKGQKPFDVLDGLQMLVKGKFLPRLTALGIYLANYWEYDEHWNRVISHGRLRADFWASLRSECPRLHSLSMRNVGHGVDDPYMSGPVVDQLIGITGLSVLRLEWIGDGLSKADNLKIYKGLPHLASSLHTLSLRADYQEMNPILDIDFPNLRWLCLLNFVPSADPSMLMTFFRRHPHLESLSIINRMREWFPNKVEEGFLPNLKHLKAGFPDIRHMTAILPQLISLSFTESLNCQVPYLLREVLPRGLPRLRSLEIDQVIAGWEQCASEGVLWYETVDGQFRRETKRKKIPRDFLDEYMHSIVRGAPNLEELGIHGLFLNSSLLTILGRNLSQFEGLKRFYYNGFSVVPDHGYTPPKEAHGKLIADFLSGAEALGKTCTRLERVTSFSGRYLPYVSAIIERDSAGEVVGTRRNDSVGMLLSSEEDDPFPWNNVF